MARPGEQTRSVAADPARSDDSYLHARVPAADGLRRDATADEPVRERGGAPRSLVGVKLSSLTAVERYSAAWALSRRSTPVTIASGRTLWGDAQPRSHS